LPKENRDGIYIGAMIDEAIDDILMLATKKRENFKVSVEYKSKGFKSQLKSADRVNAKYCAIIGEDELKDKTIWIKDLKTKEEKTISIDEFLDY